MNNVAIVSLSDIGKRGSMLPRDFMYQPGERITIGGKPFVVALQLGRETVLVSEIEKVPGSSTEFCCTVPRAVNLFDIDLRKTKR